MNNLPDCMYDYRPEWFKAKLIDTCNICSNNIYAGEEYYDFEGEIVCSECLDEYVKCFKKK